MTSLLVLLGLLSVATLLSRRGAVDELLQSAATPLLIGVGVLLSPRILGVLTPSVLTDLVPAVEFGATALAFFIGLRAAQPGSAPLTGRIAMTGLLGVVASCAIALFVLRGAAWARGEVATAPAVWAMALFVGACMAGLPAESDKTGPRVQAWAHITEYGALVAALAGLALLSASSLALMALMVALGACGAVLLLLLPAKDGLARTVALLGVLALVAGLTRLVDIPGAAPGFLIGLALGRTGAGVAAELAVGSAERPVRVVLTIVVAASIGMDWGDVALGAVLALGQLLLQIASMWLMRLHRTLLGSALASSSTPIAWIASLLGAAQFSAFSPLLPAILVAVAAGDFLAVAVGLVQRRALATERNQAAEAP